MSRVMFLTIAGTHNIVKHYTYCQKHFETYAVRENVSGYVYLA